MSVIRQLNNPQADFQMIPRRLVRLGLTAEAVGLMVIVACAPPGDALSAEWIERETGFGRDKRQRVMRELVGSGLLRVRADQGADGRWSKTYVFDWALLLQAPKQENPVSVKPGAGEDHRDLKNRRRKTRLSRRPENPVLEVKEEGGDAAAALSSKAAASPPSQQRQEKPQASCRSAIAASLGLPVRDPVSGVWSAFRSQDAEKRGAA